MVEKYLIPHKSLIVTSFILSVMIACSISRERPESDQKTIPVTQAETLSEFKQLLSVKGHVNQGMKDFEYDQWGRVVKLNLSRSPVNDKDILHIGGLRNLSHLNLRGTNVTDDGLVHVLSLRELTAIDLSNTAVTDEGLRLIKHLENLEVVILMNTNISDQGLAELNNLPNLRYLDLSGTSISRKSIAGLAAMPKLQALSLFNTQIHQDDLEELQRLENLLTLSLGHTGVTHEDRCVLQERMPMCSITSAPLCPREFGEIPIWYERSYLIADETLAASL